MLLDSTDTVKGLYSAETTVAYYVGNPWHGLANSGMTPEYRAALDPKSEEYRFRVGGSKNQLVGWLVYTVLLWTLKTCMLIFYSRLTYVNLHIERDKRAYIDSQAVMASITCASVFALEQYCSLSPSSQPSSRSCWDVNPSIAIGKSTQIQAVSDLISGNLSTTSTEPSQTFANPQYRNCKSRYS